MVKKRPCPFQMNRKSFYQRVWNTVAAIPPGMVASYGQVAELSGYSRGARYVSRALGAAPDRNTLPWHRVVNAQGKISIPKSHRAHDEQIKRLRKESVEVDGDRIDMSVYGWQPDLDELLWGPSAFAIDEEPDQRQGK